MSAKRTAVGRPTIDSERVDVRFSRELLDGIEAFSRDQPDQPSRQEAVRRLVRDHLIGLGVIPDGAKS